jgi:hypothetical protein
MLICMSDINATESALAGNQLLSHPPMTNPAQKAARTRKRRAAAKKAANTKRRSSAATKAAATRKRRAAARKAAATRAARRKD